jgi:predicted nucleic acid-binding protein
MIYLDACLVIYLVENHPVFAPRIEQCLLKVSPVRFAISLLIMAEVLVVPFREKNTALIDRFEAFFASCKMLAMPETVFIEAARLRAVHVGLKTPDALHLAVAQFHQCGSFWTNDDRLQKVAGGFAVNISKGIV